MGSKKNKSSKKKNSKKNVVKNDTASSIEINTQIRQPHNITMISKSNLDSERQSDNLNETDDKSDDLKFNELYKNTLRKSKIVSEASISSDIDHKDLQSISETKSFDIEKIVDIQRDDSALRSCVRNSRSSQDENSSTSKSKSGRKKVVKHPTIDTLKEVDINDDNSQFDSLKNQKNESLQKIKKGYIGREKIKHQLLRPEGLHRSEFWHSYVNEPRSPVYILCRFQIKERKISQERSKKTLIKKAIKIWFTGITRTNTTNNKKPEGNPVVTNIVCEDRTCDIHVFDPFSIEE
ncbi:unnamed protein product [Rhizophagus irregularis]|uniref:Uncharacterized protein n=1 Tax=Rhizophagus irregularis TaxID=588596 RepID=A0A915Z6X5_9GLOM|nr:unnamed protein product [Rhizophagus irregularis]CAB4479083.1 unnamed protein product [Rhizophagus irregularis]CAB5211077.1 unnamed protein product [Rhizophagus irregularis]CAB5363191.1 unnamed protein product [Rhizophagus irregularis]CAB5375141.1 unnamed protein product [Rhizophagus irregularis]